MEFASSRFRQLPRALPFTCILYPCQNRLGVRVTPGLARFARRLYFDPNRLVRRAYPDLAYEIDIIPPYLGRARRLVQVFYDGLFVSPLHDRRVVVCVFAEQVFKVGFVLKRSFATYFFGMLGNKYAHMCVFIFAALR